MSRTGTPLLLTLGNEWVINYIQAYNVDKSPIAKAFVSPGYAYAAVLRLSAMAGLLWLQQKPDHLLHGGVFP